jgi:acetyl esterase/lipase
MLFVQPSTQYLRADAGATRTALLSNARHSSLYAVGVQYDAVYARDKSAAHDRHKCDVYFPIRNERVQLVCERCNSPAADKSAGPVSGELTSSRSCGSWCCFTACLAWRPSCSVCSSQMSVLPPLPETKKQAPCPVVLVIHGGGWKRFGRRTLCGLHGNIGRSLAARGFVAVVASYRLSALCPQEVLLLYTLLSVIVGIIVCACMSAQGRATSPAGAGSITAAFLVPFVVGCFAAARRAWCSAQRGRTARVRHPEHVHDVAEALEWTVASAATFGGDPSDIALLGHSAGAHLISMLLVGGVQGAQAEAWRPLVQR